MASFAGWNTLNITSGMFSLYGMNIILNHFYGTIVNAAMGIAMQLTGVMMGVSSNMLKALTPILVKSEASRQRERMLDITYIGCKYSYLLFSFFCIPIYLVMPWILDIWLEDVPEWTNTFCRLMIVSTLVEQLFVFLYQTISAEGNIRKYNIIRSIINIIPIFTSIICCYYKMPPYWVIINWIIFKGLIGGIINLYYCKRNVGLSISAFYNKVLMPTIGVTTTPCILYCLYTILNIKLGVELNNITILILLIIINIPVYWHIGMNRSERKRVVNILNR